MYELDIDFAVRYYGIAGGAATEAWLNIIGRRNSSALLDDNDCMLGLMTRYESGGNLRDAIHRVKPSGMDMTEKLRIMLEIATGLYFLHSSDGGTIIHGDLKPENILLGEHREID